MSRVFTQNASNYLSPADNAAYQLNAPSISMACWIKLNTAGINQIIVGQTGLAWYFRISSADKLDAETSSVSKLGSSTLTTGTWYHVALTSDASGNWVWYLNGTSDNSGTGFTWGSQDQTVKVGQVIGVQPFDGKMAYLAIWNTGLSSANVTSLQTSTTPESIGSGCIASWHMDTSSLADSSSTNNILVVNGTVNFDSDNPSISTPTTPLAMFGGN